MTYQNIGLNEFMQPINSPIATYGSVVTSYEFNSNFERNSVSMTNIKSISFNIQGEIGTAGTLKGKPNSKYTTYNFNNRLVGAHVVSKYAVNSGSTEVQDFVTRTYEAPGTSDQNVTYNTNDIYKNDGTTYVREAFAQLNINRTAGTLTNSSWTYGLSGQNYKFGIILEGTAGNGFMSVPEGTADSNFTLARSGSMYYNTGSAALRMYIGSSWKTIAS